MKKISYIIKQVKLIKIWNMHYGWIEELENCTQNVRSNKTMVLFLLRNRKHVEEGDDILIPSDAGADSAQ
jgi:hypothetical protein